MKYCIVSWNSICSIFITLNYFLKNWPTKQKNKKKSNYRIQKNVCIISVTKPTINNHQWWHIKDMDFRSILYIVIQCPLN